MASQLPGVSVGVDLCCTTQGISQYQFACRRVEYRLCNTGRVRQPAVESLDVRSQQRAVAECFGLAQQFAAQLCSTTLFSNQYPALAQVG